MEAFGDLICSHLVLFTSCYDKNDRKTEGVGKGDYGWMRPTAGCPARVSASPA